MQYLQYAYQGRDLDAFAGLLSTEPGAEFLGPLGLGATETICLHRRMFEPENLAPGEAPVPPELWLASVTISLTPLRDWVERPDLYRSTTNPQGLDPGRWRALETEHVYDIFFDTQDEIDFRCHGRCGFIVLQDRSKSSGEDRQFVFYRWEERGAVPEQDRTHTRGASRPGISDGAGAQLSPTSWSDVLALYGCEQAGLSGAAIRVRAASCSLPNRDRTACSLSIASRMVSRRDSRSEGITSPGREDQAERRKERTLIRSVSTTGRTSRTSSVTNASVRPEAVTNSTSRPFGS